MRRFVIFITVIIVALSLMAHESDGKVGLVLSGGGAKGVAHIGVIQAFEDNGIPIDYITGTSMGAIVGSLYASGYSPSEMMALLASPGFAAWSTGQIDPGDLYFFLQEQPTPSLVKLNFGKDSTHITSVLPMSLINPIPMNMAFLDIYSRFTAQCGGDFNRLFVPFRCVTSDVYAKHKVVLGSGSLADAVRMSMSFPMVFEPIELDGVPMYDGGIYDNYPVDVMVDEFDPQYIIGVNVGSKDAPPTTRNPMSQIEEMIMQPNDYPFPTERGVNIRIDLDQFSLLDFGKSPEIYAIGYRRGLEMIDSIRMKIKGNTPKGVVAERRAAFKGATPQMKISGVKVTGGSASENAYLESLFRPRKGETTLTFDEARDAYYRAISSGKLQNFVPTPVYNPSDSTFTLNYRAVVKENYTVGIGGYISSSTTSMLFFHTGYNTLSFKSLNANVNGWLGQSYKAVEGKFKVFYNTRRPSSLTLRVVGSQLRYHETEKLFYEIKEPDFIRRSEFYTQGYFTIGPTLRSRLDLQFGWGHLTDRYHSDLSENISRSGRDKGIFNLWQAALKWQHNTLDNTSLPTSGSQYYATVMGVAGKYRFSTDNPVLTPISKNIKWMQLDLNALHYWPLASRLSLGTSARALLSTRKLLPTYEASIVAAEALHPTPSSYNFFSSALRANSFLSLSLNPVWKISDSFQARGSFDGFLPMRKIEAAADGISARYGRWLCDPEFFGELQLCFKLPLGTISAYGNYTTGGIGWNFGISLGTFILAPRFLGSY